MSDVTLEELRSVAGPVSRETFLTLVAFQSALLRWNKRINLISGSTEADSWGRHILDSAQLFALAPAAKSWLDLGSGGGLPGLVLAILLKERPGASIVLVESNRKKAGFLQAMTGEFNLPAKIQAVRIEDVSFAPVDVVTARALAPLPSLLGLTERWLSTGSRGFFHKGRDYENELTDSLPHWSYDLIEHPSVVGPQSVILEIRTLRQR